MDSEKRLTGMIITAVIVVVGGIFLWRYVIEPGMKKAAQRREAQRTAAAPIAAPVTVAEVVTVQVAAAPVAAAPVAAAPMAPVATVQPVAVRVSVRENLIKNSAFSDGLARWQAWPPGTGSSNLVSVVDAAGARNAARAIRIENGDGEMIGVQQLARITSGHVYRLSAQVRSVATNDASVMFGGRVACYMAGQPEKQLVWMSEYHKWWQKDMVFTNTEYDGVAVIYAHMGYGKFTSTGEFTDIRLERIQ